MDNPVITLQGLINILRDKRLPPLNWVITSRDGLTPFRPNSLDELLRPCFKTETIDVHQVILKVLENMDKTINESETAMWKAQAELEEYKKEKSRFNEFLRFKDQERRG